MTRLPQFCFVLASFTGLVGMSLGIYMGIVQDRALTPVHVHLNLLGWVGMFLAGLYYHTHEHAISRLAVAQVGASTLGYISMMTGLAAMLLTGNEAFLPLAIIGSLLVWLGMFLFLTIVWRASRRGHQGASS